MLENMRYSHRLQCPARREECTPDVNVTDNYVNCIFLLLKRKGLLGSLRQQDDAVVGVVRLRPSFRSFENIK